LGIRLYQLPKGMSVSLSVPLLACPAVLFDSDRALINDYDFSELSCALLGPNIARITPGR
jgi:hypothetical protein